MIFQLYTLFFFLLFLLLFTEGKILDRKKYYYFVFFALLMLIIFKDGSILPDYHMYKYNYQVASNGGFLKIMEPSYFLISLLFSPLGELGFYFVLASYGAISIILYFKLVRKTSYPEYSTLLLFSNFFIIFLLIQIRGGIALCLIYLAILNRGKTMSFFKYISLAIFFHYSSIIFIPFIFIDRFKLSRKNIILLLLAALSLRLVFFQVLTSLVSLLPVSYLQKKLITYSLTARAENFEIDLFGAFIISKLLLLLLFVYNIHFFKKHKELNVFLKLYVLGVFIYISFSAFPEIAVRISNVLFFSELFLIPYFIRFFKQQSFIKFLIIIFAFFMLYINLNYTSYLKYQIPI